MKLGITRSADKVFHVNLENRLNQAALPNDCPACPCGSGRALAECCGVWHGGQAAPDAERLMRSRYSAFVLGLADYLLATWAPSTRPHELDLTLSPQWLGLEVRSFQNTGTDQATVEFVARFRAGGREQRHHELSRFILLDNRWFYVDGDFLA